MNYFKQHSNILAAHLYEHLIISRLKIELFPYDPLLPSFLLTGATSLKHPLYIKICMESNKYITGPREFESMLHSADNLEFSKSEFQQALKQIEVEYQARIKLGKHDEAYADNLRNQPWTHDLLRSQDPQICSVGDSTLINDYNRYKYCYVESRINSKLLPSKETLEIIAYIVTHFIAAKIELEFEGYHDSYLDSHSTDYYIGHRRCVTLAEDSAPKVNTEALAIIDDAKKALTDSIKQVQSLTQYYRERDFGVTDRYDEKKLLDLINITETRLIFEPTKNEVAAWLEHVGLRFSK